MSDDPRELHECEEMPFGHRMRKNPEPHGWMLFIQPIKGLSPDKLKQAKSGGAYVENLKGCPYCMEVLP